jgi:hypothetical protein
MLVIEKIIGKISESMSFFQIFLHYFVKIAKSSGSLMSISISLTFLFNQTNETLTSNSLAAYSLKSIKPTERVIVEKDKILLQIFFTSLRRNHIHIFISLSYIT